MTLPAHFEFGKHAVRLGNDEGVNPSGRFADRFVKPVDSPDHIIEPGISGFLTAAGVPHAPVSYAFRGGEHLVHAPWMDGKRLSQITPEEAERVSVPRALHTITAEWLAGVPDRHGGNYSYRNGEVHPLDFSSTGAPTAGFRPFDSTRGALLDLIRRHKGVTPSTPLPTARALAELHEKLKAHHAAAMAGWPEDAREVAAATLHRKLAHLEPLQAETIISANIGCIQHLQSGSDRPVRHWVEVLDEALA